MTYSNNWGTPKAANKRKLTLTLICDNKRKTHDAVWGLREALTAMGYKRPEYKIKIKERKRRNNP